MIPVYFAAGLIPAGFAIIAYAWLTGGDKIDSPGLPYTILMLVVGVLMVAGGVLYLLARFFQALGNG